MRKLAPLLGVCLLMFAGSFAASCAYAVEEGSSAMEVTVVGGEDWENETAEVAVVAGDGRPARGAQKGSANVPKTGDVLETAANIAISCAVVAGSVLLACLPRIRHDRRQLKQ